MLTIGVIGYGYWGPNIVRNFSSIDSAQTIALCDLSENALRKAKKLHPTINTTRNADDIITSKNIDAVAIITPVSTHFDLAKKALQGGKHVFVEKPFTSTVAQAEELIELADKKNLRIMVDHTFLFTGAVTSIKEFVDEGTFGKLYYYDSVRINLGLFQHDVNVVWDLAPHDFAIMNYVIPEKPLAVSATGEVHCNGFEDVAYVSVYCENNVIGAYSDECGHAL